MAQSLKLKFESQGSTLAYPISPADPQPQAPSPSQASTMHNQFSLNGNPDALGVIPRYDNTGENSLNNVSPTKLQPFGGPQNNLAAAAGFNIYKQNSTYDDFIITQGLGGELAAARFQGLGVDFVGGLFGNPN